jgi:hypothetical protein
MANGAATVNRDQRIQRVAGLHVDQVRPGAKHLQGAQCAAVFVRNDVVRVVRAGTVISEPTEGFARNGPARDRSIGSVR